ncbi:folate-binding protein 1-like [Phragmites australis]|uniref:folate-binding protein 1-like n=1 Tax=Phragmites australis TaxID=29695 RepID=UPI002D7784E4|nr:folate-binding protein 1-like [Phragmites australis]
MSSSVPPCSEGAPAMNAGRARARAAPPAIAAGQPKGVCVSPCGRFRAFSSEGKIPGRAPKVHRDLAPCRTFHQNTCCDMTQTFPALVSVRNLALIGEGSQECLNLWELLEDSICDPRVGVRPGPPVVCASFCDMVFKACPEASFSVDMKTQALSPCGLGDILCGKAHKWVSNDTELCHLAGFSMQISETSSGGVDDTLCYGGKASLDSKDRPTLSGVASWDLQDFLRWAIEVHVGERVSWAIGGMVLTAGLIFISRRKSYYHHQKQAAIVRTMRLRKLDSRANPQQLRRS